MGKRAEDSPVVGRSVAFKRRYKRLSKALERFGEIRCRQESGTKGITSTVILV